MSCCVEGRGKYHRGVERLHFLKKKRTGIKGGGGGGDLGTLRAGLVPAKLIEGNFLGDKCV